MKATTFSPPSSFDEAKLIAAKHWNQFRDWLSETDISYSEVILTLEGIYDEIIQNRRNYDSSRSGKVTRLLNEYEMAKFYRHFRDFGSLEHYNTQKDTDFDIIILTVLNELIKFDEDKLTQIFPTLEDKNYLALFLEDEQFTQNLYSNLMKHPKFGIYLLYIDKKIFFEATDFLRQNLKLTLKCIPSDSLNSSGLSKMLRIIIGVIIYAYYALADGNEITDERFLKILKISYYFSISHPLIDNILDSNSILSSKEKEKFGNWITSILNGKDVPENIPNITFMKELYRCCSELKKLVPIEDNISVYNYIRITHLSQFNENNFRVNRKIDANELFVGILVKSAFIRISAASLTGYPIDKDFILNSLIMGLNNQMSNDFEGVITDYNNDVATPYTLHLNNNIEVNPIDITIQYILFSSRFHQYPELFIKVSLLRFVETIREFIKNYGEFQYSNILDKLLAGSILVNQRDLLEKIGKISFYSIDVHQETFLLDYFDLAARKYTSSEFSSPSKR